MDSIFKLNETDKLFNRNYLYTDRKCDFNKIHDWMNITNNEVKNVNGQYNFRKLIDTYQNKVQKMIDNSKQPCDKCNIQFIDTDMHYKPISKTWVCGRCADNRVKFKMDDYKLNDQPDFIKDATALELNLCSINMVNT